MPIELPDSEIVALVSEEKITPGDLASRFKLKPKRGHSECDLDVVGRAGSEFIIICRQLKANPLDFSIILGYRMPGINRLFRLKRYNGNSHRHTNIIERVSFDFQFHIHIATERYQMRGGDEEGFAEPTTRYTDFDGALGCLLEDCGFPLESFRGPLFGSSR